MCADWQPATWANYDKHFPEGGANWQELTARTAGGKRIATYRLGLASAAIERMEMRYHEGFFLYRKGSAGNQIDYYFLEFADVIGASKGEETRFVLVLREQSGPVHGYPITVDELEKYRRKARQQGNANV